MQKMRHLPRQLNTSFRKPVRNDETIVAYKKSDNEGTADFSLDDIGTSTSTTIHLVGTGLSSKKASTSDVGIGPLPSSKNSQSGDKVRSGDNSKYASANLAAASKRTLVQASNSLNVPADYQVIKKLGEGGMGVVILRKSNENLDRTVAVKAIKAGKRRSERKPSQVFSMKRRSHGDLDHPNIVPIHDWERTKMERCSIR